MSSFTPDLQGPTPPVLPPKPGSHETSRIATPHSAGLPPPPPPTDAPAVVESPSVPDPGDQWLPKMLQDKSKQDLATILSSPPLLSSITHAPSTIHPSLLASHHSLSSFLSQNTDLASRLADLETHLARQRAASQATLLSAHALERQWRQKQVDMDHALAPFSPAALYQRLALGVQEQAGVCTALEESFLEGEGGGGGGGEGSDVATEREVADWVRRYREAKVQSYLRQERKDRWDEGRVGGWR